MRDVSSHDGPAAHVHDDGQLDQVDSGQSGSHEQAHPDHSLVVDQMQDILRHLQVVHVSTGGAHPLLYVLVSL